MLVGGPALIIVGPNLLWLLLALALVGSGGGPVYAAKRRPQANPYEF
jgi:hypothetical protein